MIELVVIFFGSFFIGFSGAVMPGPLLALTVKESLNRSKGAALWLSSGHSLCELVIVGLFVGGISRLIPVSTVMGPIGLVGGSVLVWMAYGAFKQAHVALEPVEAAAGSSAGRSLILGGAAVTVSNPYWLLWWLTVGMGLLISAQLAGVAGVILFYIGHILSDFVWFGFVGFMVGRSQKMLGGKLYKYIIFVCAALLAGFGFLFIGHGARTIGSTFIP
jgi:threonine/homoserine/homoserine lactone efflux protein